MKILSKKRMISFILFISLMFTCLAFPTSAMDFEEVDASEYIISEYPIEVDGTLFNVSVRLNEDGTKTVTVVGGEETISWTTVNEEEPQMALRATRTASYGSFRYIYSSTAASVWNLYRPLQSDGGSSSKGVGYDSGYCQSFAEEVDTMKAADERISDYLKTNNLASSPGSQILLGALGGYLGYYVAQTAISATIAGAVGVIISSFIIPAAWEAAIAALVQVEYYNIRNAMGMADYYYELA